MSFLLTLATATGIVALLKTAVEFIMNFLMSVISGLFFIFSSITLHAMTSVTTYRIETWLNNAVGADFKDNIRGIGLFICLILATWEMLKYVWTFVTGDNPQTRPGAVAIRIVVYGAWTVSAISISKTIFTAFQKIYEALYSNMFGVEGLVSGLQNFFGVSMNIPSDRIQDMLDGLSGENVGEAIVDFATGLAPISGIIFTILGTGMLVVCMFSFCKLLLSSFSKFATIMMYIYLSPLATACGVSPTLRGITWSWFKNFISNLICWIINLWMIYAALCLMGAFSLTDITTVGSYASSYFMWAGVLTGWIRCGLNLDSILKDVGLSVTHSSGSVLQDMREMDFAGHQVGKFVGGAKNVAAGVASALTRGAGVDALNAAIPGAGTAAKALGASLNNGAARSKKQIGRDVLASAVASIKPGQTLGSFIESGKTIGKAMGLDNLPNLKSTMSNFKSNGISGIKKSASGLANDLKDAWNGSEIAKEIAAHKSDEAGAKCLSNLNKISALDSNVIGNEISNSKNLPQEKFEDRLKHLAKEVAAPGESSNECFERMMGLHNDNLANPEPVANIGDKFKSQSAELALKDAENNGFNRDNIDSIGLRQKMQESMFGSDSDKKVTKIETAKSGTPTITTEDSSGNTMRYKPATAIGRQFAAAGNDGSSGIFVGSPETQWRAAGGTTTETVNPFDGIGATSTHVNSDNGSETTVHVTPSGIQEGGLPMYDVEQKDSSGEVSEFRVKGTQKSTPEGIASEIASGSSPSTAKNIATKARVDENGKKIGGNEFDLEHTGTTYSDNHFTKNPKK